MNEETPALTQSSSPGVPPSADAAAAAPPPVAREARGGAGWAVLAALVALAAAGAAGWQTWETRQRVDDLRVELARRLSASDAAAAEARTLTRQLQDGLAGAQGKLGALESKVEATEGQAAALESLYQEFSRTREDRVLAEVEQSIGIAAQQLQLAGNVEAALVALQEAESRLAALDHGQLASLRRALAHDIDQLKTAPQVDVPGVALRLENLITRVDNLPLAFAGAPAAGTAEPATAGEAVSGPSALDFARRLAGEVWKELKTLVRIERLDQPAPALLAPEQSTYLRENLKIRLLTARLALLSRDGRTYDTDLAEARQWIERFFDGRDKGVGQALQEVDALRQVPVGAELPPLLESFAALHRLQARADESRASQTDAAAATAEGARSGKTGGADAGAAGTPPRR